MKSDLTLNEDIVSLEEYLDMGIQACDQMTQISLDIKVKVKNLA